MREMNKDRISWIESLKGIGIILVVLGHTFWGGTKVIYAFHMPLFFFVSGMLFKEETRNPKKYLIKK